MRQVNMRQ